MRIIDATVLTALNQARAFIDTHLDHLGQLESAGYRHKLDDVIAKLERLSVEQDTADRMSHGQSARQRVLRAALRLNHMRPIAAIAAARLRDVPEFNGLRMPLHRARITELVIVADAMAKIARQYAPVFIEAGLAADFAERLETAADALATCATDRQMSATMKAGASAGLRTEASRGRHVLRVLGALIEPRLENDEALLTGWRTARHIRRPARPQPVVFPLMGLALAHSVTGGPAATPDAATVAATPAPFQLALPPAPMPEALVSQETMPQSSAFGRAAQIIAGDGATIARGHEST